MKIRIIVDEYLPKGQMFLIDPSVMVPCLDEWKGADRVAVVPPEYNRDKLVALLSEWADVIE